MEHTKEAMTTKNTNEINLVPLQELTGVELKEMPDFRGWMVKLADGVNLGTVNRLFLDTKAHEVRYLEVKVDPKVTPGMTQLLVPVGRAQLDPKDDVVMLPTLNKQNVMDLPKPVADKPTQDFELSLIKWFGVKQPVADQLYTHDVFDLKFLLAKRPLVAADAVKN